MSKSSIDRDRWRQLGQSNYDKFCPGCGYYHVVHQAHRADCTLGKRAAR